jgi:hypothetical protein
MAKIAATYKGLITGALMIALMAICFYGLKLPFNGKEQYLVYTIYTAGIVWSLLAYQKTAGGTIKFKDYFSAGFKTFVIVTLMMVIFTYIFYTLNTQYRDNGIAENNKLLLQEGNHTPAEIENNAQQLKKIFMPMMLGINTFKYLILGVLVTVVGAGFLSKKNN